MLHILKYIFRCLIYIHVISFVGYFPAKAQSDYNFLKYSLKTNVFQWGMNEPNIGFEYRFSPKIGWENTIGTYGINNRSFHTNMNVMEPLPQKGITFRSNLKWYYQADNTYNRDEYYFSPMFLFKKNVVTGSFGHYNDITKKTENRTIIGGSLLYGIQKIRRHFLFDFYFGLGLRYRYIQGIVTDQYIRSGPPDSYPYKFTKDEWVPSIHLGIKLGYNFRGTPQEMNRTFDAPYFKHSLTTHLISTSLREQNIAYEYRINRQWGLEASIGGHIIKYKSIRHEINKTLQLTESYSFNFQPKLYLGYINNDRYTYYVAPMVMYRSEKYKRTGTGYYKLHDRKIGPSLLTGCQIIQKSFVLNFYLGIGSHKHFYKREWEGINGFHVDNYANWKPAIHGGVKLGYGFKLIN